MTGSEPASYPWHERAPHCGNAADLAAMRGILEQCGFTAEGVCQRLGIPEIREYKNLRQGRGNVQSVEQPLDALIHLLMDGEYVERGILESLLPPGTLRLMEALGLAAFDAAQPERCYGAVTLFPVRGLLLASDRGSTPDNQPYALPADVVYPAATLNTFEFMASLPETPCEAFLDLGAGTGIAALDASRYARHAWATDIAARSVEFAEFNRRLNGIENVTVVEGDLYQPAEGLTFDRIVAHLPYVPARRTRLIYRDGGEDGEEILRRAIEGLPRMLRPGGRFYTMFTAADCEDETLEDRIRRWLGADAPQFDLVLAAYTLLPPRDALANLLGSGSVALDNWRYDRELWERRKVTFLFHGSVLIRRHAAPLPAFTARVLKGEGFGREHTEWLLDWETAVHDPAARDMLLNSRPALSPHCELAIFHAVRDGRFAPQGFSLGSKRPFQSECICQQWLAQIVSGCDGRSTWREHLEKAKQAGWIDPATTPEEFVQLLDPMVANGFLRISEMPLPES